METLCYIRHSINHMKINLGAVDRLIRLLIGTFLLVLLLVRPFESLMNSLFLIIGFFLVISACSGTCMVYSCFRFKTVQQKPPEQDIS
jgi:hypothetical protein